MEKSNILSIRLRLHQCSISAPLNMFDAPGPALSRQ